MSALRLRGSEVASAMGAILAQLRQGLSRVLA